MVRNIRKEEIESAINERIVAKQNKEYAKADEIRNELDSKGIILFDTKEGTDWGIKDLYTI